MVENFFFGVFFFFWPKQYFSSSLLDFRLQEGTGVGTLAIIVIGFNIRTASLQASAPRVM